MTGTLKTTLIQNPSSADVNITLGTAGQVTLAKSPVLNGSTSGTLTIAAAAVAGTNTITFPAATDTVATLAATQTLTNKTIQGGAITSATAQASTSGTSIDFTGIPSWVKRITVMFNGVSTSGTSVIQIQIGSTTFTTTGYVSSAGAVNSGTGQAGSTTGFALTSGTAAASSQSGAITLSLLNTSTYNWVSSGTLQYTTTTGAMYMSAGTITLSGVLDRVRITTVGGTDTFDAGSINIMYE